MLPVAPRVALYGGAFNPPTRGHLEVVRLLRRAGFDRVVVMPCCGHSFGKKLAPAADRLALARACFAGESGVFVSSFEIDEQLDGSTHELLQRLKRHPEHARINYQVVIGSDEANVLHRWKRADELRAEARFVVVPRKGHPLDPRADWVRDPRHRVLEAEERIPEVASTAARAALEAGDLATARSLLPSPVVTEIHARGLYLPQTVPALTR
jgi:nicotinate-nucleotide adenylyltransferase